MRYFIIFVLIFLLSTNVFGKIDDSTKVIIQKKFPKMDLNFELHHYNGKSWKKLASTGNYRIADYNNGIFAAVGNILWTKKVNVIIITRND